NANAENCGPSATLGAVAPCGAGSIGGGSAAMGGAFRQASASASPASHRGSIGEATRISLVEHGAPVECGERVHDAKICSACGSGPDARGTPACAVSTSVDSPGPPPT